MSNNNEKKNSHGLPPLPTPPRSRNPISSPIPHINTQNSVPSRNNTPPPQPQPTGPFVQAPQPNAQFQNGPFVQKPQSHNQFQSGPFIQSSLTPTANKQKKKSKKKFIIPGIALGSVFVLFILGGIAQTLLSFTNGDGSLVTALVGEKTDEQKQAEKEWEDMLAEIEAGTNEESESLRYESDYFKNPISWVAPPASEPLPGRFSNSAATPEEFLSNKMGVTDVKVVISSDPKYNCGYHDGWETGGCYNPRYGKVIFFTWAANANSDLKELVLLHEYSHYHQHMTNYDVVTNLALAGRGDIVERDATCRVYHEWNYKEYQYLDDSISPPCGSAEWNPDWMTQQAQQAGISIEPRTY